MDFLDMSVTLIVKAPNQQIEDQTIKCEPTWTIKKLKGHLSEVYPSKPRTEDQKLIYSGQLLADTCILKDILHRYEGQEAHTVHLVCTPSPESFRNMNNLPSTKMAKNQGNSSFQNNPDEEGGTSASSSNTSTNSTDGLRHRLTGCESSSTTGQFPAPNLHSAWTAAMTHPYATGYDPNNMMQQLAVMQQAYAQYIAQYMQMMASANPPLNIQPQVAVGVQTSAPHQQNDEQGGAVPVNQYAADQPAENVNGLDGDDEARGNRDWLDWFYFLSRLLVLLSIVYFYSSPTRFMIVSALAITMYLYQVGFFRVQQAPLAGQAVPDNNNVPNRASERNVGNNNENETPREETVQEGDAQSNDTEQQEAEPDRPSILAITWTFFSSFFISLMPEQPGPL